MVVFAGLGISASLVAQVGIQGPIGTRPANLGGFYPSTGGAASTVLVGNGLGSAATFSGTPSLTSVSLGSGTLSNPSAAFTADPDSGLFYDTQTALVFGGSKRFGVDGGANRSYQTLELPPIGAIAWGSSSADSGVDTGLIRNSAAGALAIMDGNTPTNYRDLQMRTMLVYKSVTTAGWGLPGIYGYGNTAGATGVTASIATFMVGAADGTFEVSANCLVTTATAHSFSLDVTYTDEGNTARTMILPIYSLAGTPVAAALIVNTGGTVPYHAPAITIQAKAATAITVRTSAGGTYTTVVYNARGSIKQIG